MSCPNCGRAFEELDPRLFSFNSPHGAVRRMRRVRRNLGPGFANRQRTDDGESVLENELAAERESEWIDEGEAQRMSELSRLALERGRASRARARL